MKVVHARSPMPVSPALLFAIKYDLGYCASHPEDEAGQANLAQARLLHAGDPEDEASTSCPD